MKMVLKVPQQPWQQFQRKDKFYILKADEIII